jgi:hypothetical protein
MAMSGSSAQDWRRQKSSEIMSDSPDDMLPEYDLDDSRAQPNRFAGHARRVSVTLRDDVLAYLEARSKANGQPIGDMVNDMLEKDIELSEILR